MQQRVGGQGNPCKIMIEKALNFRSLKGRWLLLE